MLAWSEKSRDSARPAGAAFLSPPFEQIYDESCVFVWRSLRGLGVPEAQVDDALQEVFIVVHRKLPEYEPRGHIRSWLFGIAHHVARGHRRTARRKPTVPLNDEQPLVGGASPFEQVAHQQALSFIEDFADTLSEDHRAVFVLAEIEQMRIPEIAELLGENLNTVYSRHRAVRKQLQAALTENPEIGAHFTGGGTDG